MKKNFKKLSILMILALAIMVLPTMVAYADGGNVKITVLGTSDLHGRIYPYNYATDSGDNDAGLALLQTLIKEERAKNPNTILMDCGDTAQDNSAELFNDQPVHPMIEAFNAMGYDIWTLGNHEFNFEKSFVERNIKGFEGTVLAANIYNEADGTRFVKPYEIFEKDGVRVAVIGMIPPHVPVWEASAPEHFKGLEFTPILEETKKVIKELEGKYDVLVGAYHLGPEGQHGYDGVEKVAEENPEFDVIFCGHAHSKFDDKEVNGVKLIEPGAYGWALAKADIEVAKKDGKWTVESVNAKNLQTKGIEASEEITEQFKYVHDKSVAEANTVVGKVTDNFIENVDFITGEDKVTTMPTAQLQDTAVIDLINEVQMHYADADVSSAALFNFGSNLKAGDFKKKDVAYIYKYPNTLTGVKITGANLKKYMEWSASYFNTYKEGDVTVSFNPEVRGYNYDMFSGVDYKIDLSKEVGNRIVNPTIGGQPIDDEKVYKLAVNNYRFGSLQNLGVIKPEDKYYDAYELMQDNGRIRDLIVKYVQEENNGLVTPKVDNNWSITGVNLDNEYKSEIFELVKAGEIKIPTSEDGRTKNVKALNVNELIKAGTLKAKTVEVKEETKEEVKTPEKVVEVKSANYTVKGGDVLWKIAKKFKTTWEELAKMNNLKNPNMIMPGQVIVVPAN